MQIVNGGYFAEVSQNQHGVCQKITPKRGKILLEDKDTGEFYPAAINQSLFLLYANPKFIKNKKETTEKLSAILKDFWIEKEKANIKDKNIDFDKEKFLKEQKEILSKKINQKDDPYVVLAKKVPVKYLDKILSLKIKGIGYERKDYRYYPEADTLSQITGFVGYNNGEEGGQYGIEGAFNDVLKGGYGSLYGERDGRGYFLMGLKAKIVPAKNGKDIVLTIDKFIQHKVCKELEKTVEKHSAESGTVVVMNPFSGEILAMCSYPSYNANYYFKEKDLKIFNNPAIFKQYEPGSIFKPIIMAAGLDSGKVSPSTTYFDEGCLKVGVDKICNSDLKSHKIQTMTNVLEKSLNTGVIFVLKRIGRKTFQRYVKNFGFGDLTGIEMFPEVSGNINSLNKNREIYGATASFGQGITVTPIQMVSAFSAIANGGILMKPHIVKKIISEDGSVEKIGPEEIRRVIKPRTSALLSGMLVSVVENGHGKPAKVKGYYVAGKTGTAQVPKKDGKGYEKDKNIGSFIGFAPIERPRFVMLVRIDNPKDVLWAESSAAPLFGDLAKFLLNYYEVKPERNN